MELKMKSKLLAILMSLAMAFTIMPALGETVYAGNSARGAGQGVYLDLKYEGSGHVLASEYIGTEGTTVEISALPSDGYRFKNWEIVSGTGSIGAENNNLTTFTMGTTDATVKAVFEILPSTETSLAVAVLNLNNVPPGTASATVDPNNPTSYRLTATPASGYQFSHWYIRQGSGTITNSFEASTTITDCRGSVVVEACFSTITYPITTNANPSEGGSTEGLPYWGGPAQQVDLTATPNDGYVFKEWKITSSGAGRITNPTEAFTVLTDITEAVTCQAEFEQIPSGQYRVSVTKNFAEMGEAKANVSYASPGTKITLSATPASGYKFNGWKVSSQNVTLDDPNSATTTFTIGSEPVNVIAYFIPDKDDYNVTTQTYGCGKMLSGNDQAPSGSRVGLEAIPESGWSFDHWEVVSGGVTIDNEYAREASFVMRDQDVAVRAVFVPEQTNLLTEIKVTNPPKKDTYTAGESFDPDGMVVTAYYQDGSADVSGYTYEPSGALAETDTLITIRYTINGVTKETTLPITVSPRPAKVSGTALAKMTAKKKSITISWNKIQGAAGYDIFFAQCNHNGKKIATKNVKTIKGNKTFKWTKSGLKKGTAYKAYVRAYVYKNGKKTYVRNSPLMHAYTGNGTKNYTNAKSVSVNKTKVTLKKGKTFKIKAKVKKVKKNKKLMPKSHAPTLRYMTSNSKIASVNSGGKITAKGKGTCYIYTFAHNGVSKQVKVTVK